MSSAAPLSAPNSLVMKQILISCFVSVLIIACQSNSAVNNPAKVIISSSLAAGDAETNVITFKVNGEPVKTAGWTISRVSWSSIPGALWLNITSDMHQEKRTININLDGSLPGEYFFNEDGGIQKKSHGSYFPDYMGDMTKSYSFVSGSVRILSIDTIKNNINAVFSGMVKNLKGETFEITDGKIINGSLKSSVTKL
jgi:hypothetical protein